MLANKLRSNFKARVMKEREVVALVNRIYVIDFELVSLGEESIVRWAIENEISSELKCILVEIGKRIMIDHNVSNEMFPGEEKDVLASYEDLMVKLKNILKVEGIH